MVSMCLGNPHVHIHKNFSSFFFFPHPLSCLHAMLGWKYIWNFFVLFIFREKAKKCCSHNSLKNFIIHHYNSSQNTSKIVIFQFYSPICRIAKIKEWKWSYFLSFAKNEKGCQAYLVRCITKRRRKSWVSQTNFGPTLVYCLQVSWY